MTAEPLLTARSLQKAFARTQALDGASLEVNQGELVAVTGASGSGKSTLLLCLAGVLRPEGGQVHYAGHCLDDLNDAARSRLRRQKFGLVLQFGQLVPELTAVDNVALPLLLERHGRAASRTAARTWLDRMGAAELADAVPGELSGGQAQRVAIARALVAGPTIIFADEPTGALDSLGGRAVMETLTEVARETKAALIVVTHDNRVAAYADREVRLVDGRIVS